MNLKLFSVWTQEQRESPEVSILAVWSKCHSVLHPRFATCSLNIILKLKHLCLKGFLGKIWQQKHRPISFLPKVMGPKPRPHCNAWENYSWTDLWSNAVSPSSKQNTQMWKDFWQCCTSLISEWRLKISKQVYKESAQKIAYSANIQ